MSEDLDPDTEREADVGPPVPPAPAGFSVIALLRFLFKGGERSQ